MKVLPLLAAFDQIITLVVFALLAAASSWLAKRRQAAASDETQADPHPRPATEDGRGLDPEEMLRRLFGAEPPPAAEPPPLPVPRARKEPPPPRRSEPKPAAPPAWHAVLAARRTALPPAPSHQRPELTGARASARAVASRGALVRQTPRRISSDGAGLVAQLRHPAALRQAFLAAQIFGPPKSLEK